MTNQNASLKYAQTLWSCTYLMSADHDDHEDNVCIKHKQALY